MYTTIHRSFRQSDLAGPVSRNALWGIPFLFFSRLCGQQEISNQKIFEIEPTLNCCILAEEGIDGKIQQRAPSKLNHRFPPRARALGQSRVLCLLCHALTKCSLCSKSKVARLSCHNHDFQPLLVAVYCRNPVTYNACPVMVNGRHRRYSETFSS